MAAGGRDAIIGQFSKFHTDIMCHEYEIYFSFAINFTEVITNMELKRIVILFRK